MPIANLKASWELCTKGWDVVRVQRWTIVVGLIAVLSGCSTAEINGQLAAVNRAVRSADMSRQASTDVSAAWTVANSVLRATFGSVNFRRRMQSGADILRSAVENSAMQLRVGADFVSRPSVNKPMLHQWSVSCDLFYPVSAHLFHCNPPADKLSKFTLKALYTLNEVGLAVRHSGLVDSVRRRPAPTLNSSVGRFVLST